MHDFRSRRFKLPLEAFAYAPGPDPEPSDLVDEATWMELISLPDDASIRTSDHHGGLLRAALDVWSHWIGLVLDVQSLVTAPRDDPLALACLVVSDELQASTFGALTGFYRQAIAGLRSALDAVVAGAYFRTLPDPARFAQWGDGYREGELWMSKVRKSLSTVEPFSRFETSTHGVSAPSETLLGREGWLNFLYAHLSGFSHGCPFYLGDSGNRLPSSNVELWGGSNGPVYEPRSVRLWSRFYFDVALISLLVVGLTDRRLLSISNPADIHYLAYLERLFASHFGPPPIAREIVLYLTS